MKEYHIFPDYCSTGVWTDEGNTDLPESIPKEYHIALHYWHREWDRVVDPYCPPETDYEEAVFNYWYEKWWKDGEDLVELMNSEARYWGLDVVFIYEAEKPDDQ